MQTVGGIEEREATSIAHDPEKTMTLILSRPFENPVTHELIERLELREPTAREWIEAAKVGGGEGDLHLLATITGIVPRVLGRLAVSDYVQATSFLTGFVRDALQTGAI